MQRDFSPMNAAELMDKVFDIYKKSFWKQIAFSAIIYVIALAAMVVLTFILTIILMVFIVTLLAGAFGANFSAGYFILIFGIIALMVLPFVLIWQAFSSSGHILLSRQAFYGFKVRLKHMGLRKVFFRVFSSLVAQVIIAIPFVIIFLVILFAFVYTFENIFLLVNLNVAAIIGFFIVLAALGFGYLLISNIFSLSIAVAVFERRYFFGTVTRSWELIKKEFWRILGIRVVWYLAAMAFSVSAQGLFMLASGAWDIFAGTIPMIHEINSLVNFITQLAGPLIVVLLVAPLEGIMQSLIYFNQRMKNEGLDLEIRLEKLQNEAAL
jgi:hypothetical protein